MKSSSHIDPDQNFESFNVLLQIMRDDPVIHEKLLTILKLDSYQRRLILNNWLEQLRRQDANKNLSHALSCLFDDTVVVKVLKIIKYHRM